MLKTIACAAFSLLSVAVIAQQNPAPQPKRMLTWVAAQAPQVKRLSDALSGKWKTTEKFEADEFRYSTTNHKAVWGRIPAPESSTGTVGLATTGPFTATAYNRADAVEQVPANGKAKTLSSNRLLRGIVDPSR
ncbi:MAG: hypothetical protein DMG67_02795 [Acidobacteria bacterium]|nr:MAG: hypothetical protein DMG67_02795 [Acidobacteriota bacterium]